MDQEKHVYDPIQDVRNCVQELKSKYRKLTLNETKELIKVVEESATKSMNCAKKGMYYRHWCNTVYYINNIFVEIDKLKENKTFEEFEVRDIYNRSIWGIEEFALFAMKHFREIKEVIVLLGPVFENTKLALIEFSKFLGELFKKLILSAAKKIQEWWDWTIETIKSGKWHIVSSGLSCASVGGITRAFCQSAVSGTAMGTTAGIAQHCLYGGLVGIGVGITVSLATGAIKHYQENKSKKKQSDFELKPEIDAGKAEKLGLVELYFQFGELIKLVEKIWDENDQAERDSYVTVYSRFSKKLNKMRNECPRIPNTSMDEDKDD